MQNKNVVFQWSWIRMSLLNVSHKCFIVKKGCRFGTQRNACKYTSFSKLFLLLPSLLKGGGGVFEKLHGIGIKVCRSEWYGNATRKKKIQWHQRNHPKSHLHKDGSDGLEFNLSRKYSQQNSVSINASSLHLISLRINVLAIEGW